MNVPLLLTICTLLAGASAQAATVKDARYNEARRSIEVDVSYTGCAGSPSFDLEVPKFWGYTAKLTGHLTLRSRGDEGSCGTTQTLMVEFPLERLGLNGPSFANGAHLFIHGDGESVSLLELPALN